MLLEAARGGPGTLEGMVEPLVDPFERTVRDLRISITDRCNLRCTYCMPAEGLDWLARDELLRFEELVRIARVAVERFGFDAIRITGGEPTVRKDLVELIRQLAPLGVDLALTTNGLLLPNLAAKLREAGLHRMNISLDSLQRERVLAMTRRDALDQVLAGIDAALDAGFAPLKVNVVLIRAQNDDEILDFAAFGRDRGIEMRFIEFMPLDADHGWNNDAVVPSSEVVAKIGERWPLEPVVHGPEPAARWRYADGQGQIGVIASVTEPFCGNCDRVRVTSEGQFRTCLFAIEEFDLRRVMREGGSDDDLAAEMKRAVGTKWAGHHIGQVDFVRPARSMSQIGG